MDWMLDASIEICNTLVRLEANGRDLSATECKNIIAKHYAAQQSLAGDATPFEDTENSDGQDGLRR